MLHYIFYSTTALGITFLLYRIILKKEKILIFNRFFLLASLILCLLSPTLQLDWGQEFPQISEFPAERIKRTLNFAEETPEINTVEVLNKKRLSVKSFLVVLYILISGFLLFRFGKNLFNIKSLITSARKISYNNFKIVEILERRNPFSFFNYLFIHTQDLKDPLYVKTIFSHEAAHSRQLHSADILFVEFLSCFFWFNPFVWFYKKDIIENHEFLADQAAITSGVELRQYSLQMIRNGDNFHQKLFSGFSFIQTKNRLNMLHKEKSSLTVKTIKIGAVLILFAAVFAVSSFTSTNNTAPFVVIVDSGHGGNDPGNYSEIGLGGLNEKDINFQITQHLKNMSRKDDVKIILIKEQNNFLTLKERAEFVNKHKPDFFLSLHCSASKSSTDNGISLFFSPASQLNEQSRHFTTLLATHLVEATGKAEIKTANFYVLKNSIVPSALLEMGFMTNPEDLARFQDPIQQKKIAETIYNGLRKIKESASK